MRDHGPLTSRALTLLAVRRSRVVARADACLPTPPQGVRFISGRVRSLRVLLSWERIATRPCVIELDGLDARMAPCGRTRRQGGAGACTAHGDSLDPGVRCGKSDGGARSEEHSVEMIGSLVRRILLRLRARVTNARVRLVAPGAGPSVQSSGQDGESDIVVRVAELDFRGEEQECDEDGELEGAGDAGGAAAGMWLFSQDTERDHISKVLRFSGLSIALERPCGASVRRGEDAAGGLPGAAHGADARIGGAGGAGDIDSASSGASVASDGRGGSGGVYGVRNSMQGSVYGSMHGSLLAQSAMSGMADSFHSAGSAAWTGEESMLNESDAATASEHGGDGAADHTTGADDDTATSARCAGGGVEARAPSERCVILGGAKSAAVGVSGRVFARVRLATRDPAQAVPRVDARVEFEDACARASPGQLARLFALLAAAGETHEAEADAETGSGCTEAHAHAHALGASTILEGLLHDPEAMAVPPRVEGMDMSASMYYDPNAPDARESGQASWGAWGQWMSDVIGEDTQTASSGEARDGDHLGDEGGAPAAGIPAAESYKISACLTRITLQLLYSDETRDAPPPEAITLSMDTLVAVGSLRTGEGPDVSSSSASWAFEVQTGELQMSEHLHCGSDDDALIAEAYTALAGTSAQLRGAGIGARWMREVRAPLRARRVLWLDAPCGARSGSGRWSDARLQVRRRGQLDELEIKAELGPLGICLDASLVPRLARVFECMAAAAGRAACTADSHNEAETAPTRKDRGTDGDEGDDEGGGPCRLEASLSIPAVRLLLAFPEMSSFRPDAFVPFVTRGVSAGTARPKSVAWRLRRDMLAVDVLEANSGVPVVRMERAFRDQGASAVVKVRARRVAVGLVTDARTNSESCTGLRVAPLLEASGTIGAPFRCDVQLRDGDRTNVRANTSATDLAWRAAGVDVAGAAGGARALAELRDNAVATLDFAVPRLNVRASEAHLAIVRDELLAPMAATGASLAYVVANGAAPTAQTAVRFSAASVTWQMDMDVVQTAHASPWHARENSLRWSMDSLCVDHVLGLDERASDSMTIVTHGAAECTTADGQMHLLSASDELLGRSSGDGSGAHAHMRERCGTRAVLARRARRDRVGTVDTALRCEVSGVTLAAPSGGMAWLTEGVARYIAGQPQMTGAGTVSAPRGSHTDAQTGVGEISVLFEAKDMSVALTKGPPSPGSSAAARAVVRRHLPVVICVARCDARAALGGMNEGTRARVSLADIGVHVPPPGASGTGLSAASARGLDEHAYVHIASEREVTAAIDSDSAGGVLDIEVGNAELNVDAHADVLHALGAAVGAIAAGGSGGGCAVQTARPSSRQQRSPSFAERALREGALLVSLDDTLDSVGDVDRSWDEGLVSHGGTDDEADTSDILAGVEEAMRLDPAVDTYSAPLPSVGYFGDTVPDVRDAHVSSASPGPPGEVMGQHRAVGARSGAQDVAGGNRDARGTARGTGVHPVAVCVRARGLCARWWLRAGLEWGDSAGARTCAQHAPLLSSALDATTALQIAIDGVSGCAELLAPGAPLACRLELAAADLKLWDCSAAAAWSKVLSVHDEPADTAAAATPAARLELEMVRPARPAHAQSEEAPEARLRVDVVPLRARLDQQVRFLYLTDAPIACDWCAPLPLALVTDGGILSRWR